MAIVTQFSNTSTPIAADDSDAIYLIGADAIVTSVSPAVDGDNDSTHKTILVLGGLVSERNGISLDQFSPASGGNNQIEIAVGGFIFGRVFGVHTEGGGDLIVNEGSIRALGDGVNMSTGGNEVVNFGTIVADGDGVDFNISDGNTLTNYGRIGGGDEGVEFSGGDQVVINHGEIFSSDRSVGNEAVEALTNVGETSSLFNYGRIAGAGAFGGGSGEETLVNRGVMTGVVATGGGDDVLRNSGLLDGAVDLGGGADWFANAGEVAGDVALGGGNDRFFGQDGRVEGAVDGEGGNDVIRGGAGEEDLRGGAGNDILEGGAGGDAVEGGAGFDRASYAGSAGGVAIDLARGLAMGGDANGDTLTSIEFLEGSTQNDALYGTDGANWLIGGTGDDVLQGRGGNDNLRGGAGADQLIGGTGVDTAIYDTSREGVVVDLGAGTGSGGEANGDALSNVENVIGSNANDAIFGNGAANSLVGNAGNDVIAGGGGDDVIDGRAGNDRMNGGSGADTFLRRPNEGQDTILDFQDGLDTLDLSAFSFANTSAATLGAANVAGDVVFTFAGGDTLTVETIAFAQLQDDIAI